MKETSNVTAAIKRTVLKNLISFRFAGQFDGKRFFELRFKQPPFGMPFTFSIDDPKQHIGEEILLTFSKKQGKSEQVTGTITKVEHTQSPGFQSEVIISGWFAGTPDSNTRFTIMLAALLLIPLLAIAHIVYQINALDNSLIQQKDTTYELKAKSGGKGRRGFEFKLKEPSARFERTQNGIARSMANTRVSKLLGYDPNSFTTDTKPHQVTFYIAANDLKAARDTSALIPYYYLKSAAQPESRTGYYYDLYSHTSRQINSMVISGLIFLLTIGGCLYTTYYYLENSLNENPVYNLSFKICMAIVVLLSLILIW